MCTSTIGRALGHCCLNQSIHSLLTLLPSRAAHYSQVFSQSWEAFKRRTAALAERASEAYRAAVERSGHVHKGAMEHTVGLIEATPILRDLFPSRSDREMLLVYFYILLGALATQGFIWLVRNVLYA